MKATVYGVGINDADYVTSKWEEFGYVGGKRKRKLIWFCPHYRTWKNMLKRCYLAKFQERYPTYIGCSVSDDWLTFSNFKRWMENQKWEGKQLDKDLLVSGNKVYSADTCVFVTREVNMFTTDRNNDRGEWMIGAYWDKGVNKFVARCCNPFTKKQEYLGLFISEQEAHNAWIKRKLELAHELAAEQTDERVARVLIERYESYN